MRLQIQALHSPQTRVEAALRLAAMEPMPEPAAPLLLHALIDLRCPPCRAPQQRVERRSGCNQFKLCLGARAHVVEAILNVGPAALNHLARALRRPDPIGRLIAVEVIGHLGRLTPGAPAVVALTFGLSDPDPRVRSLAANMLALIAPRQSSAVAALARTATDRRRAPRCMAVAALLAIGALERDVAGQLRVAPGHAAHVSAAVAGHARTCPRQIRSFHQLNQTLKVLE